MTNDKPMPPDGYEVRSWEEMPDIVPYGSKFWNILSEPCRWQNSNFIGESKENLREDIWCAIPITKESTPQVDILGTDPKGDSGKTKAPMWLLPPSALVEAAWTHKNGAERYGPYNWRTTKVVASTYISAMMRHWAAFLDGEDVAEDSGCTHLGHIIANCNILIDAKKHGTLIDDRPKRNDI